MSGRIGFKTDLSSNDYEWIIDKHREAYIEQLGWGNKFVDLVSEIVRDFEINHQTPDERCWMAMLDDRPVGCIFLVKKIEQVAKLRLFLVDSEARGLGIGSQLVQRCIEFARERNYSEIVLWTNSELISARKIYESQGFHFVSEEVNNDFARSNIFQYWSKKL